MCQPRIWQSTGVQKRLELLKLSSKKQTYPIRKIGKKYKETFQQGGRADGS